MPQCFPESSKPVPAAGRAINIIVGATDRGPINLSNTLIRPLAPITISIAAAAKMEPISCGKQKKGIMVKYQRTNERIN